MKSDLEKVLLLTLFILFFSEAVGKMIESSRANSYNQGVIDSQKEQLHYYRYYPRF